LHLNPSVCRDILPFMFEAYAVPKDLQLIICSHSPQVLTSAFDRDDFALHHLESPTLISKVGRRAFDELADALERLGVSVSETLLYKGTVLVEGEEDVRLLEEGFSELLRRYKVTDRGGRREVEKTIARLQDLERRGSKVDPIYLIFDHDNAPTNLQSSGAVKILQWSRHCIENYLIDLDVITELLKSDEIARQPGAKSGEISKTIRELAFSQLNELAARKVYNQFGFSSPSFHSDDVDEKKHKTMDEIARVLFTRVSAARQSLSDFTESEWISDFIERWEKERKALEVEWESTWIDRCDGKRLFSDFMREGRLKVSTPTFKKRIMQQMKSSASQPWRLMLKLLSGLINPTP
jgi:Protein of unknown function (DUF4435)